MSMKNLLLLSSFFMILFSCSGKDENSAASREKASQSSNYNLVASNYALMAFAEIVTHGVENVTVQSLIPDEFGCAHNYMLKPRDLMVLQGADGVLLNGLGMDGFVEEALKSNKWDKAVLNTSKGAQNLLLIAPNPHEEESHDHHEHEHNHEHGIHQEMHKYNAHLFAGPKQAIRLVKVISEFLSAQDSSGASVYRANAAAFVGQVEQILKALSLDTTRVYVSDHSIYSYLLSDLALKNGGVISVHEEAPSASKMMDLKKILQTPNSLILVEPGRNRSAAEMLAKESGAGIVEVEAFTHRPNVLAEGQKMTLQSYIGILENNFRKMELLK